MLQATHLSITQKKEKKGRVGDLVQKKFFVMLVKSLKLSGLNVFISFVEGVGP